MLLISEFPSRRIDISVRNTFGTRVEGATVFFFLNGRQFATIPSTRDKDPTIELFDYSVVVQVKITYQGFSATATLSQDQNEWICTIPPEANGNQKPSQRSQLVPAVRAELGILHITDLHCGQRSHADFYPTMRSNFLADLERIYEHSGPWDLVLFTGDLTFRGSTKEFVQVDSFLDDLSSKLNQLGSGQAIVLTVPGNHDLERPSATNAAAVVLSQLTQFPFAQAREIWDELLDNTKSEYRLLVDAMFKNYSSWRDARDARSKKVSIHYGLFPGDFILTYEKSGARFGIVGLNSTFLQVSGGDFKNRLAIHTRQFNTLLEQTSLDWPDTLDAAILLTHQPQTWLAEKNRDSFYQSIAVGGRFALHLCGHQHVGEIEKTARGGGEASLVGLGRSLLALEPTEDGLEHLLGYQTFRIKVDRNHREGLIRAWPRSAIRAMNGELSFGPDRSFILEADDGTPDTPANRFLRPNHNKFPPA